MIHQTTLRGHLFNYRNMCSTRQWLIDYRSEQMRSLSIVMVIPNQAFNEIYTSMSGGSRGCVIEKDELGVGKRSLRCALCSTAHALCDAPQSHAKQKNYTKMRLLQLFMSSNKCDINLRMRPAIEMCGDIADHYSLAEQCTFNITCNYL